MKKLALLVCAAFCAIAMNAQLVTSTSQGLVTEPKAPKESKTTWMFKVGMATNNFVGENWGDSDTKIGYNFGFEFNRTMGKKGAYWGMDFLFGSRGYKYSEGEYDFKHKAHNFQWSPFTFGWKVDVANKITIDPHLGVFLAIDYAGKQVAEYDGEEGDISIWDVEDYIPVDLGMKIGVGVWFNKKFNLDLTYQRGFVNAFDFGDDYSSKTNNFLIRLGYAF